MDSGNYSISVHDNASGNNSNICESICKGQNYSVYIGNNPTEGSQNISLSKFGFSIEDSHIRSTISHSIAHPSKTAIEIANLSKGFGQYERLTPKKPYVYSLPCAVLAGLVTLQFSMGSTGVLVKAVELDDTIITNISIPKPGAIMIGKAQCKDKNKSISSNHLKAEWKGTHEIIITDVGSSGEGSTNGTWRKTEISYVEEGSSLMMRIAPDCFIVFKYASIFCLQDDEKTIMTTHAASNTEESTIMTTHKVNDDKTLLTTHGPKQELEGGTKVVFDDIFGGGD